MFQINVEKLDSKLGVLVSDKFSYILCASFPSKKTTIRLLSALSRKLPENATTNLVKYDHDQALKELGICRASYYNAIKKLIIVGFIAKAKEPGSYWVSPDHAFVAPIDLLIKNKCYVSKESLEFFKYPKAEIRKILEETKHLVKV